MHVMAIGAFVRRLCGPYEHSFSEAYRSIYLDLDAFAECIQIWKPNANRILEIGCGEGAVTERLAKIYPRAEIIGIDIAPRIGRLYRGPTGNVRFLRTTAQHIAAARPAEFDLVILADVLHHVPLDLRNDLLAAARAAIAPNGAFVLKDWERAASPIHALSYVSDRWITGDRVLFMTASELREKLTGFFGMNAVVAEARVKPWRNNIAFLVLP
jgi:2-polyprenyl-3-methyl-5-hydroxy-6-metoxy-1,4-benzoquinol methylase